MWKNFIIILSSILIIVLYAQNFTLSEKLDEAISKKEKVERSYTKLLDSHTKLMGCENQDEVIYGDTVDHIDNNPLNNNVTNLRVITKRENSSKDRKGISKYTGVTFNKKSNKWRSQIWINGKNKTLGSFDDELEAHRAYQKELQQHLKS